MKTAQNPNAAIGKDRYITDGLRGQIPPIRRELGITNCGAGLECFSKCERDQARPDSYQEKAAAFC